MDINLGLTADATGTPDVITATYSPAPTLVDKKILFLVASGENTSVAPTFSPNGLAAHPITKCGGQPLLAGDICDAGFVAILEYNLANTRWEMLNPANAIVSTISTSSASSNPNDAATVYWGGVIATPTVTQGLRRIPMPFRAKFFIGARLFVLVTGGLGSAEASTWNFRINGTTDNLMSNTVTHDAQAAIFLMDNLVVPVVDPSYFEIKVTHPTYVSNPTAVLYFIQLYFL